MRVLLVVSILTLTALAGCSGSGPNCPEEYGPEYAKAYKDAKSQVEDQGGSIPDADNDCVPDVLETEAGSDPNDAKSYPDLQQLGQAAQNVTYPGAQEAPVAYEWQSETFTGDFTTTQALEPAQTGAGDITVPGKASRAFFNVTITGTVPGETTVRFSPPSCTSTAGCDTSVRVTTVNGAVSTELEDPEAGTWTLATFATMGVQTGSYSIEVNAYVQTAGSEVTEEVTATIPANGTAPPS